MGTNLPHITEPTHVKYFDRFSFLLHKIYKIILQKDYLERVQSKDSNRLTIYCFETIRYQAPYIDRHNIHYN